MRVLLLGAGGQLGVELAALLAPFARVTAPARGSVDLADFTALRDTVAAAEPQVIVNCAAYNDVDGAERDEERATRVNGLAVGLLGEEAARRRALLVHYSTDFVFDGMKAGPYLESDAPRPLSAYGRSKLAGERALVDAGAPALVFRTAWVYGLRRKSFVRAILEAARAKESLRVVDDQVGSPTAARDLAVATALVLFGARRDPHGELGPRRGVYHLAGGGQASRWELASAAIELDPRRAEHRARTVERIGSADLALPAARPAFAPLDCDKARRELGVALPPWRESLARVLSDIGLLP